jgi:hypothetical protein
MGVRNHKKEQLDRLECKTLDAQFVRSIVEGLNCSPFEAEAVLEVVKEVYFPFLDKSTVQAPPGKITLVAVCADEPPGKSISQCTKRTVCLSLHRGIEDDKLIQAKGPSAFRQARIVDLCQEALSQGSLLTREDLAYRIFFVSTRTISRDLALLRKFNPALRIPLRSTVQDMGPVLSHRVEIVRLALAGKTMSEICVASHHSPKAVANYLSTFTRCAQLAQQKMHPSQIAFLLHRSRSLIERYLELLKECQSDPNFSYHLDELLRIGRTTVEKKRGRRGSGETGN